MLKVSREILYRPFEKGEVNLKNIQLQAYALIINRLIKCLCEFSRSLLYDSLMIASHYIDDTFPIDSRTIRESIKMFDVYLIDVFYAVVGDIPLKEYSVEKLYQHFLNIKLKYNEGFEVKFIADQWLQIGQNLKVLKYSSLLHHQIFLQICSLDYYGGKKGIIENDLYKQSGQSENHFHKLIMCMDVWYKLKKQNIYSRIMRCVDRTITFENIFCKLYFRIFLVIFRNFKYA